MEGFLQLVALVILAVVACLVLKLQNPPLSMALGLTALIGLCVYGFTTLSSVLTILERLEDLTGLDDQILSPVLKTALVGILTNMTAAICGDGGQAGMGKMVEICGSTLALYLSMPLISAVLDMLTSMMGG